MSVFKFWINCCRPNPLQYFLVPDIEVENGAEEDEDFEEEEDVDESVRLVWYKDIKCIDPMLQAEF